MGVSTLHRTRFFFPVRNISWRRTNIVGEFRFGDRVPTISRSGADVSHAKQVRAFS